MAKCPFHRHSNDEVHDSMAILKELKPVFEPYLRSYLDEGWGFSSELMQERLAEAIFPVFVSDRQNTLPPNAQGWLSPIDFLTATSYICRRNPNKAYEMEEERLKVRVAEITRNGMAEHLVRPGWKALLGEFGLIDGLPGKVASVAVSLVEYHAKCGVLPREVVFKEWEKQFDDLDSFTRALPQRENEFVRCPAEFHMQDLSMYMVVNCALKIGRRYPREYIQLYRSNGKGLFRSRKEILAEYY